MRDTTNIPEGDAVEVADDGVQLEFDFGDDSTSLEVTVDADSAIAESSSASGATAESEDDHLNRVLDEVRYDDAELTKLVQEFNKKTQYLKGDELRSKGADMQLIDMDTFFEEIFTSSSQTAYEGRYEAEEIQSKEYLWWLEQKKNKVNPIDYTNNVYKWRYNPIVVYVDYVRGKKVFKHRIMLYNDTESYKKIESRKFAISAPITYVGHTRYAKNARYLFAFAIDLDGVGMDQMRDLFHQQYNGSNSELSTLPKANIVVNSGTGLHLYYMFDKPIQLKPGKVKILQKLKHYLTQLIWNPYTSSIKQVQYQGIYQGFRLPGTKTKFGTTIQAFQNLDAKPYSIAELNKYTGPSSNLLLTPQEIANLYDDDYRSDYTLKYAKENWPDWYEDVIIKGKKKDARKWKIKPDLYYWWLKRLRGELEEFKDRPMVGHRYFCIFTLAVYAAKCKNISKEQLKEDAYSLLNAFDKISDSENNRFTQQDVDDALKACQFAYRTFPRNSIEYLTGLKMPVNRRNGRKRDVHLKRIRALQKFDDPEGQWRLKGNSSKVRSIKGKKDKGKVVKDWMRLHPNGTKAQCVAETHLNRVTVARWWQKGNARSKQMQVMLWCVEHSKDLKKSQCARDTGFSRTTIDKYWPYK